MIEPSPAAAPRTDELAPPHGGEEVGATQRATVLQRVASVLASSLDREQMLRSIVEGTIEALGASAGVVAEMSRDGAELRVVYAAGYPEELIARFATVRIDEVPAARRLARARAPIFMASHAELAAHVPEVAPHSMPAGARAVLPIVMGDRCLGVLALTYTAERPFGDAERELLTIIARQCAYALERGRPAEREAALRLEIEDASAQLSDALERMSDLHFVCDSEWRYLRMNRAMRDFLREAGFDPEPLMGCVVWDVFPRLVGGAMHQAMQRAVSEGVSVTFEARGTYADSWYEGSAYPVHAGVAVHAHDTTERRRAEREVLRLTSALKRRVEEMETLLEVIPVGIGIATDADCTEVLVNPALAGLLEIPTTMNASNSAPTAANLPFRVLRDDREVPADQLPLQLAARSGEAVPYADFDILREDGGRITLLESAAPIFDDEGVVRGSVGAFVDITSRKRAETAARVLAEASAAFATSLDVGATFTLLAQRVVPALADVCAIFVVRESGSVGVAALVANDDRMHAMLQAFDAEHPVDKTEHHPVRRVLRDKESILVKNVNAVTIAHALAADRALIELARVTETSSMLMVPIPARGEVLGVMGLGTRGLRRHFDEQDQSLLEDLARRAGLAMDNARLLAAEHRARSDAERAHADAERASRAKSDFLAMMSHELRTPLNAIAGYAELIELGLRGPVTEGQIVDLQKIKQNQRHLLGLINSVLNFARLDAGRVHYDITHVPVAASLRSVKSLIEPQVTARDLSYAVRTCEAAITVLADSEKLQQVLLNLLGNATKFTPRSGSIELSCEVSAERVHVRVRDSGVGIPADQLESIFEPFVQGKRASTNFQEGVGLGLAICRELTQGMGGSLTVESEVGAGSVFTVMLRRGPDRDPTA